MCFKLNEASTAGQQGPRVVFNRMAQPCMTVRITLPSLFMLWQLIITFYLLAVISNIEWLEYLLKTGWGMLLCLP